VQKLYWAKESRPPPPPPPATRRKSGNSKKFGRTWWFLCICKPVPGISPRPLFRRLSHPLDESKNPRGKRKNEPTPRFFGAGRPKIGVASGLACPSPANGVAVRHGEIPPSPCLKVKNVSSQVNVAPQTRVPFHTRVRKTPGPRPVRPTCPVPATFLVRLGFKWEKSLMVRVLKGRTSDPPCRAGGSQITR